MKRFTSLFLLLCLLLTTALLSSCGNPKSLVNKAVTKKKTKKAGKPLATQIKEEKWQNHKRKT